MTASSSSRVRPVVAAARGRGVLRREQLLPAVVRTLGLASGVAR